jgi:hypothetical protein
MSNIVQNLAAVAFEEKRFGDAEERYRLESHDSNTAAPFARPG